MHLRLPIDHLGRKPVLRHRLLQDLLQLTRVQLPLRLLVQLSTCSGCVLTACASPTNLLTMSNLCWGQRCGSLLYTEDSGNVVSSESVFW